MENLKHSLKQALIFLIKKKKKKISHENVLEMGFISCCAAESSQASEPPALRQMICSRIKMLLK